VCACKLIIRNWLIQENDHPGKVSPGSDCKELTLSTFVAFSYVFALLQLTLWKFSAAIRRDDVTMHVN